MIDPHTAQRHYNANAAKQDAQGWYEDAALQLLTSAAQFETATHIIEAGCGTGRYAKLILQQHTPNKTRYTGIDFSSAMLHLARSKLAPFKNRVTLLEADVTLILPLDGGSYDRFIATYVFDLLSEAETEALLGEAYRVLEHGGLLCIASLSTKGRGVLPRLFSGFWTWVARVWPQRVGGCRPVSLTPFLTPSSWSVVFLETTVSRGLTSEVIVAQKR